MANASGIEVEETFYGDFRAAVKPCQRKLFIISKSYVKICEQVSLWKANLCFSKNLFCVSKINGTHVSHETVRVKWMGTIYTAGYIPYTPHQQ